MKTIHIIALIGMFCGIVWAGEAGFIAGAIGLVALAASSIK